MCCTCSLMLGIECRGLVVCYRNCVPVLVSVYVVSEA